MIHVRCARKRIRARVHPARCAVRRTPSLWNQWHHHYGHTGAQFSQRQAPNDSHFPARPEKKPHMRHTEKYESTTQANSKATLRPSNAPDNKWCQCTDRHRVLHAHVHVLLRLVFVDPVVVDFIDQVRLPTLGSPSPERRRLILAPAPVS